MSTPQSTTMMIKLRIWIAVMLVWLLGFYNIERLHAPINLASFVYVLTAAIAIAIVAIPRVQRLSIAWLMGTSAIVHILLKVWLGYPLAGPSLPITVTELCSLLVTIIVARWIGINVDRFEEGASDVMTMRLQGKPSPFNTGQSDIYREIRRARQFERPLSMLAISTENAGKDVTINRFLQEMQRETIHNYVNARVAEVLTSETKDCDIVAHFDDHLLMVFPEIDGDQARRVAERLIRAAQEQLGVDLRMGTAAFPNEEVTFTGLVERAVREMQNGKDRSGAIETQGA